MDALRLRLIQWTLFHPRSTRMTTTSILNLLMRSYRPISSSVPHGVQCQWYHKEHNIKKRSSFPGLLCVRGAKGKAATSKSKSSMKTVPPPPDSQADKVCKGANVFKDGTDPPIKEDSEYPDWLWELAENKKSYQDFSSDSTEYWRRLRKQKAHEKNVLMKQMGRV